MTKKTRTILFLAFLILFLLIAPTAIFYSQGYRIDFDSKKISQTGGLFLKILPKQTEVYLDGKLKEKTDFFFGSLLIENLLPKEYKIEVKKEGYLTWEKTLAIKEKEVTEAKNIVLFPKEIKLEILFKNVKNLWFSPNQRKIILKEEEKQGWLLKLYELDKGVKSHLVEEKDISQKEVDLLNLEFSEDSKEVSLEIGVAEQVKYFTLNLNELLPNLIESKAPSIPFKNVVTDQKVNDDIYYLENSGHLFKNQARLTEKPLLIKQETRYNLKIFQDFIFLAEDKDFYQLNPDSKSFEKFSEGINSLNISPDSKKIAYYSDYEIWILFLKDINGKQEKKASEKLFLTRLSEKISEVSWLNSNYLVFNSEDIIKITEIDERNKLNIIDIAQLKNPEIFWNKNDKKLYILSNEILYSSEKIF